MLGQQRHRQERLQRVLSEGLGEREGLKGDIESLNHVLHKTRQEAETQEAASVQVGECRVSAVRLNWTILHSVQDEKYETQSN